MSSKRLETFEEFWPFYVGEHKDPVNRALHYAGTSMAIGTILTAVATANPAWLLLTPVVGYGPAWVGHFFVEHNKPASFSYALWSLRGDLKMLGLALQGKMGEELERLHPTAAAGDGARANAEPAQETTSAVNGAATSAAN